MNFWFSKTKFGKDAIIDIPLAKTDIELIEKRCIYVGSALPTMIIGEKIIDLRTYCPMCNDNLKNIIPLKCEDCMNVSVHKLF